MREAEQTNIVGRGAVALDGKAARGFCDYAESLQRDVAFDQARNIDMTPIVLLHQIAIPRQAVGVQVGDDQASM